MTTPTRNNELAERLSVLIEVAAALPPNVTLKLPSLSFASSLNLFVTHLGTLPDASTSVTVTDVDGNVMKPPVPTFSPSTPVLGRTVATGAARVFYTRVYDVYGVMPRRGIAEVWGGYTGFVGTHTYPEHTTRLMMQFGHRLGNAVPDADDRLLSRMLWTDAAHAAREHHVRLPFRMRDGVEMSATPEVEASRESERWREHRGVGEPHGTYHVLKVGALNALADERTTVTMFDWHIGQEVVARSSGFRDAAMIAYGEPTHDRFSRSALIRSDERAKTAAARFSLSSYIGNLPVPHDPALDAE